VTDQVVLKGGGLLRGTVAELEPGKSVAILVLGTGERRVIPWEQVEKIDRGQQAPSAPPPPLRVEMPAPASLTPDKPGVVRLHIEAAEPHVTLRKIVGSALAGYSVSTYGSSGTITPRYRPVATTVCSAPCDQVVDGSRGETFVFGGPGYADSGRFTLDDKSGDVRASVKPGNATAAYWGKYLTYLGVPLAIGAGIGTAVFAESHGSSQATMTATFGSVTGLAVTSIIVGAILWANNSTNYEFQPQARF
jgi:hypothetical protein